MGIGKDKNEQFNKFRQELFQWLNDRRQEIIDWNIEGFRDSIGGKAIRERLDQMIIVLSEHDNP